MRLEITLSLGVHVVGWVEELEVGLEIVEVEESWVSGSEVVELWEVVREKKRMGRTTLATTAIAMIATTMTITTLSRVGMPFPHTRCGFRQAF